MSLSGPAVVGFSGMPVQGVIEMRSPVFQCPDGRYLVQNSYTGEVICLQREEEYLGHVAKGFATTTTRTWSRVPNGVLLYAHRDFVTPPEEAGLFSLSTDVLEEMEWDEQVESYVTYLVREEAVELFRRIGTSLLEDARHWLSAAVPDYNRAHDSAMRARMTGPPPDNSELREAAWVVAAAAWKLSGKEWEDMVWMVGMDRDAELLTRVVDAALKLAATCAT